MHSKRDKPLQIEFLDIAHELFFGTAQREVYVGLLEEEQDGEHCGRQVKSMYGTQDASAIFQDDYTQVLENAVYHNGTASLALFFSESEDCRILVRGDDFCAVGAQDAMNVLDGVLRRRYELKITGRDGSA